MVVLGERAVSYERGTPVLLVHRFRSRRAQRNAVEGLLPESQGQNTALTLLYVPYLLQPLKHTTPTLGTFREGTHLR